MTDAKPRARPPTADSSAMRRRMKSALSSTRARSTIAVDRRPMSARYSSTTSNTLHGSRPSSGVIFTGEEVETKGVTSAGFQPLLTGQSYVRPGSAQRTLSQRAPGVTASSSSSAMALRAMNRPSTAPTTRKEDVQSSVTKPLTSLRAMLLWKRSDKHLNTYRQRLVNLFEQREATAASAQDPFMDDPVAFTTDNVTLHRHLLHDQRITTAAEAFWRVLYKEQDGLVHPDEYKGYLRRLCRTLLPELDDSQADAVCDEETAHDIGEHAGIDFTRYGQLLHEITGLWCRVVDVEEYITFLTELYNLICEPLPRVAFRPLMSIRAMDVATAAGSGGDGAVDSSEGLPGQGVPDSEHDEDAPIDVRSDFVPKMKGMVVHKPANEIIPGATNDDDDDDDDDATGANNQSPAQTPPRGPTTEGTTGTGSDENRPPTDAQSSTATSKAIEGRGPATVEMALQVYDDLLEEKRSHGRRGFLNVASSVNGGRVIEASSIFDERFQARNILNDVNADGPGLSWASDGEGVGAFVTVQLKQAFTIDTMGFMQRHAPMSHIRRVRLEFPNTEHASQTVELDDATGLIQYQLQWPVKVQRIRIVVEEMYYEGGVRNAGACAVEFWAKVNPSVIPFLQGTVEANGQARRPATSVGHRAGSVRSRPGTRNQRRPATSRGVGSGAARIPRPQPVQRRGSRSSVHSMSTPRSAYKRKAMTTKEVKWNIHYDNHVLESVIMARWQQKREEEYDIYEDEHHDHDGHDHDHKSHQSGAGTHRCLVNLVDSGRIPAQVIESVLPEHTSIHELKESARPQSAAHAAGNRPLTARDYSLRDFGKFVQDQQAETLQRLNSAASMSSRMSTPVRAHRDPLAMTLDEQESSSDSSDSTPPGVPKSARRSKYLCDTLRVLEKRRKKNVKLQVHQKEVRSKQQRLEAKGDARPSTAPVVRGASGGGAGDRRPQTAASRGANAGVATKSTQEQKVEDGRSAITYYLDELAQGENKVSVGAGSKGHDLPVHGTPFVVPLLNLSKVREALGTAERLEEEAKPKFNSSSGNEKKKKKNKLMTMEEYMHRRPRTARVLTPRPVSSKPYEPHYIPRAAAAIGYGSGTGEADTEQRAGVTTGSISASTQRPQTAHGALGGRPTSARPPTGEKLRRAWTPGPRQRRTSVQRNQQRARNAQDFQSYNSYANQRLQGTRGTGPYDDGTTDDGPPTVQQILAEVSQEIAKQTRAASTNPRTFKPTRPKSSAAVM